MLGARGATGYEADSGDDEKYPGPAGEGHLLMQPEAAEQRDDDVTEGSGGHDEGEVGPAEGGGVAGEEADEENDSCVDEGVEEGVPEEREVVHVDGSDLAHASREQGVADGCGEHDGNEDGVLRGLKGVLQEGLMWSGDGDGAKGKAEQNRSASGLWVMD